MLRSTISPVRLMRQLREMRVSTSSSSTCRAPTPRTTASSTSARSWPRWRLAGLGVLFLFDDPADRHEVTEHARERRSRRRAGAHVHDVQHLQRDLARSASRAHPIDVSSDATFDVISAGRGRSCTRPASTGAARRRPSGCPAARTGRPSRRRPSPRRSRGCRPSCRRARWLARSSRRRARRSRWRSRSSAASAPMPRVALRPRRGRSACVAPRIMAPRMTSPSKRPRREHVRASPGSSMAPGQRKISTRASSAPVRRSASRRACSTSLSTMKSLKREATMAKPRSCRAERAFVNLGLCGLAHGQPSRSRSLTTSRVGR